MKRLIYITRTDLRQVCNQELALPCLARDGWDITVVGCGATQSIYRSVLPFPCKAIDLPYPNARASSELALAKAFWKARVGRYDVIYVNSVFTSLRAMVHLLGPKFGKRIIYHAYDYYCPFAHPWYAWAEGRFCRKADLYLNCEFHRAYITQVAFRRKGPVLAVPPNLPKAWPVAPRSAELRQKMSGGREDAFVLMLHGGYGVLRRTPELFAALALLPERFRLVMTGGGNAEPDLTDRELARLKLTQRVVRLGKLSFMDMLAFTPNADAGVLLYANNDLGNFFQGPGRLTEYLSCGLPVLASDHTGVEDLVLRFALGQCVDAGSAARIAAAIETLERRKQAGEFSAANIRQTYEDHLAFDHWEPSIVQAVDAMMTTHKRTVCSPPFPWIPSQQAP